MFTTGSKLLIGSAAAAWIFAAVYGIAQEGTLGTIGLVSAATALSLLAGLNVFVRDSNVSAMDHEGFESSAAAQATAGPSLWPLLVALGATTVTLGLVTYRSIFVLGMIVAALAALGRAEILRLPVPPRLLAFVLWTVAFVMLTGAVFNALLPRFWDRWVFAPIFLVLAILALIVVLPARKPVSGR